jgi:hypothetical protein
MQKDALVVITHCKYQFEFQVLVGVAAYCPLNKFCVLLLYVN